MLRHAYKPVTHYKMLAAFETLLFSRMDISTVCISEQLLDSVAAPTLL